MGGKKNEPKSIGYSLRKEYRPLGQEEIDVAINNKRTIAPMTTK